MTLYQILFDLNLSICDRFPSLTPFDVRKESAYEVFLLVRRLNDQNKRGKKQMNDQGKRVIRRPAGDNWF